MYRDIVLLLNDHPLSSPTSCSQSLKRLDHMASWFMLPQRFLNHSAAKFFAQSEFLYATMAPLMKTSSPPAVAPPMKSYLSSRNLWNSGLSNIAFVKKVSEMSMETIQEFFFSVRSW